MKRKYKSKTGVSFQVGDSVGLNKSAFQTMYPSPPEFAGQRVHVGKIKSLYQEVEGLVLVEPKLGGFWTWNVNDLKKVE